MPYTCPHCSFDNLDPSPFCVHCGKTLLTSETQGNASAVPPSPHLQTTPPAAASIQKSAAFSDVQDWEKTLSSSNQLPFSAPPTPSTPYWSTPPPASEAPTGAQHWGAIPPPPLTPAPDAQAAPPGQQWGTPLPPHPSYPAGPMQQQGQQWGAPPNPPSSLSLTARATLASMRRAFAGYGALTTHHSWLLEGKKEQGEALASTVKEKLKQQRYSGSTVKVEKLSESHTTQEEREFLVVQRGSITEFIYIAPGEDSLYLSRATVVQSSLSYVRIGLSALLFLIVVLGPFITPGILRGMLGFSLLYSTALFFLFFLVIISAIGWLRDKDILMYLRTNRLSDFQMDDVAMLEQTTDRVVRNVVDQVGLDAIHIVPPTQGYHPKRKIRLI